jgi:hypothetical protein
MQYYIVVLVVLVLTSSLCSLVHGKQYSYIDRDWSSATLLTTRVPGTYNGNGFAFNTFSRKLVKKRYFSADNDHYNESDVIRKRNDALVNRRP